MVLPMNTRRNSLRKKDGLKSSVVRKCVPITALTDKVAIQSDIWHMRTVRKMKIPNASHSLRKGIKVIQENRTTTAKVANLARASLIVPRFVVTSVNSVTIPAEAENCSSRSSAT